MTLVWPLCSNYLRPLFEDIFGECVADNHHTCFRLEWHTPLHSGATGPEEGSVRHSPKPPGQSRALRTEGTDTVVGVFLICVGEHKRRTSDTAPWKNQSPNSLVLTPSPLVQQQPSCPL